MDTVLKEAAEHAFYKTNIYVRCQYIYTRIISVEKLS